MPTADEVRSQIARMKAGGLGGDAPAGYGRSSRGASGSGSYSPSPYRSPEYLQAARNNDAAVDAKVRGLNREAQSVRAELQRALPRLNWEAQDDLQAANDGFEARGMFNSGGRLVEGGKIRRDLLADYTDLRSRASEQVQSLVARAAEARVAGRADLANAALLAAGNLRSQISEQALSDANSRTAALQDQLRQLLGRYGQ